MLSHFRPLARNLVVCAALSLAAGSALAQASGDMTIVPGKGIGKVMLGMSKDQLFAAAGQPVDSVHISAGYLHEFKDLSALVSEGGQVVWVYTDSPDYKTPEGIGAGMSEKDIVAKLGQPAKAQDLKMSIDGADRPIARALCFAPGLIFVQNFGPGLPKTMGRVSIRSEGCANLSANG
jgi:hypothetical protein